MAVPAVATAANHDLAAPPTNPSRPKCDVTFLVTAARRAARSTTLHYGVCRRVIAIEHLQTYDNDKHHGPSENTSTFLHDVTHNNISQSQISLGPSHKPERHAASGRPTSQHTNTRALSCAFATDYGRALIVISRSPLLIEMRMTGFPPYRSIANKYWPVVAMRSSSIATMTSSS